MCKFWMLTLNVVPSSGPIGVPAIHNLRVQGIHEMRRCKGVPLGRVRSKERRGGEGSKEGGYEETRRGRAGPSGRGMLRGCVIVKERVAPSLMPAIFLPVIAFLGVDLP